MNCKVCKRETVDNPEPATLASGICNGCRSKLGVMPMPPARRPARPCGRCNGMKFVRGIPREHDGTPAPMVLTHPVSTTQQMLSSLLEAVVPSHRLGIGVLEVYVCLGCGYIEWYCQEPEKLPIGPEYMTELVDYTSTQPYR